MLSCCESQAKKRLGVLETAVAQRPHTLHLYESAYAHGRPQYKRIPAEDLRNTASVGALEVMGRSWVSQAAYCDCSEHQWIIRSLVCLMCPRKDAGLSYLMASSRSRRVTWLDKTTGAHAPSTLCLASVRVPGWPPVSDRFENAVCKRQPPSVGAQWRVH
ncbi:hypothetical protein BD413DRAFT_23132 [Trametes elegans]|nr:hypothetical protein BD413DRAFT_23132 [Trametes elegans]